jgi:hypothetical protein
VVLILFSARAVHTKTDRIPPNPVFSPLFNVGIKMDKNKIHFQLVWGALLVLMGLAFFFRIPQTIERIKSIESSTLEIGFVYFCLYLIDLGLLVGGVKKLCANYKLLKKTDAKDENIS